jgi:2-polyprenyl-6-hydroxyphenyl methylase/3-demethylubiquinone-9 3-methyltransferase
MSLGSTVRRLFGPYEIAISNLYRSFIFDADAFVASVKHWVPAAANILEVGCGEGAITQRLAQNYPDASVLGIDITPRLGRLYAGRDKGVRFLETTVQELAKHEAGTFDMIVLADVLHHVPDAIRQELLDCIKTLMAPGASFIFKEWERNRTPIYWLGYLSDRWITGDRIRYMRRDELRHRIGVSFGEGAAVAETRVRPWRNNLATLVRA